MPKKPRFDFRLYRVSGRNKSQCYHCRRIFSGDLMSEPLRLVLDHLRIKHGILKPSGQYYKLNAKGRT